MMRLRRRAPSQTQSAPDGDRLSALKQPVVWGPAGRVDVAANVHLNNALLNVESGRISFGEGAFLGHDVALLTGSHDIEQLGLARQKRVPSGGRDIRIGS